MNSEQRTATLWGFLFPLLTLGGIVGVLGLSGRGTAPPTRTEGTQNTANQGIVQNNSTMSGTGTSTLPSTSPPMTTPAAPAAAVPSGTAQAAPPQGSGTAPAAQAPAAQAPAANAAGTQATAPAPQGTPVQASANGAQVYTANCVSCHGAQGAGVAGAFPALAGNKAVLGDDKYLSNVLLYGLQGQINANGQVYNGVMPAWAASLTDAEIAAVITHIRVSWGNSAPVVTEATVKTERGTPKTVAQVLAQRPQ